MARLCSIRHQLSRLVRMAPERRALLIEAALWLFLARVALVLVPFPRLARHLGTFVPPSDARALHGRSSGPAEHARIAGEVAWAVMRAAHHAPFRAVCLPRAMAARIMLARRGVGSVLHFGAARGQNGPFHTHAWLNAAGVEVTGYPAAADFADIACFV